MTPRPTMIAEGHNIAAIYSRLAFVYDAWTWVTETKSLRLALARADIRDGEAVLEVAVGTGVVFRKVLLQNPSGTNVGIDLTEAMLRRARRKAERTGVPFTLAIGDARALTFDDGTFDVVLSNNMLGLLARKDVPRVLEEMHRVLRPGGRLVLVSMACPDHRLSSWFYKVSVNWLGAWSDLHVEPFVRETGFENVEREVVKQLGIPSEILIAQRASTSA
jgi:ubiquinone/menaquinone biosynthesis C-methylase UbiE